MPLRLPLPVARWMASLGLLKGETRSGDQWEVSFDDQLYLENGYLVGQLLRLILQARGHASESLLRIRKIAHISSNENWRIVDDILQEMSFPEPIDHHSVSLPQLQAILQFLHDHFAPHQPAKGKRQKKLHLEPTSFRIDKPLTESTNLLQFFILALHAGLSIPLSECLGLLISDCRYWQQLIRVGTSHLGYQPVLAVYQAILQQVPTLQRLLTDETSNAPKMLATICSGVMSESAQICNLTCVLMDNLEEQEWMRGQGLKMLVKSPHRQALDLLLRKIEPNFHIVFNQSLPHVLGIGASEFLHYAKLLKHLKMSIYAKQVFEAMPLSFYLRRACEIFQPDQVGGQTARTRLAARQMLTFAVLGFWNRLNHSQRSQIYFGMDNGLCRTDQEKLNCVAYLFEIVKELQEREGQAVLRFYKIIHRYYAQGSQQIRNFVLDNYGLMLRTDAERFPIGHFLQNYDLAAIVQAGDYQLLHALSQRRELTRDQVEGLLKTGTIYYYQQLQGGCFLQPLKQLVKQYAPIQWGKQVSSQILNKWPSLNIPAYQPLPPQSQKIKFRSIGLKRKEMLQFTELNRYKALLGILTQLRSREFLSGYAKVLSSTILKVQKSKNREMQNTSKWLNKLLSQIDTELYQLKSAINPSELQKRQEESEQSLVLSDQEEDIQNPPNLMNSSQNEFMRDEEPPKQEEVKPIEPAQEASPLLPFSQQQLQQERNHCQDSLYEQYQLTYIRNLNNKYASMMSWVTSAYDRSANIQHFLQTIHLDSHFKQELETVKNIEDKLKLTHEDSKEIVTKLLREMGLLLFNFKKGRRITVKCLQSFYDIIMDKNKLSISQQPTSNTVTANLDFSYEILPKLTKSNKELPPFAFCFQIVSSLLNRALGVQAVEPVSCLITQIAQNPITPKLQKINKQSNKSADLEEEQLQQLEKLIEQEVKPTPPQLSKIQSTSLKKSVVAPIISNSSPDGYEKWAQVQKKVALRRLQMQKGVQKSLNS